MPAKESLSGSSMPGWLKLIAVTTAIGPIAIDLYLPAFPAIEAGFHERGVERTLAFYLLGLAIGQLFYGPISDRFGRKPPLYVGFTLFCIGALGCALAWNMNVLILCRVVQAIGACSGMAIGRAVVRDRCEPEDAARAFSMLMTIVAIAPIVAPIAGGFMVTSLGWRAAFVVQALMGAGVLIAMHFVMTESLPPEHVQPLRLRRVLSAYWGLFKDRSFVVHSLISSFGFGAMITYISGAPIVLTQTYHIAPSQFGWIIGMNGIAFMLSSRLNMRALRKHKPVALIGRYIVRPSVVGALLVAVSLWSGAPLWAVMLLQFAFFFSTACIMPNASALALTHQARNAGTASALMGGLQSVISMLMGLLLATINNGTLAPLAFLMAGSVLICLLLYRWNRSASE